METTSKNSIQSILPSITKPQEYKYLQYLIKQGETNGGLEEKAFLVAYNNISNIFRIQNTHGFELWIKNNSNMK